MCSQMLRVEGWGGEVCELDSGRWAWRKSQGPEHPTHPTPGQLRGRRDLPRVPEATVTWKQLCNRFEKWMEIGLRNHFSSREERE